MSHPILGFELEALRKESLQFLMHDRPEEQYALWLINFLSEEYRNKSVLIAVAELLSGYKTGGDG